MPKVAPISSVFQALRAFSPGGALMLALVFSLVCFPRVSEAKKGPKKRLTWASYIHELASKKQKMRDAAIRDLLKEGPEATFALVHGIASTDMGVRVAATSRVEKFKEKAIPGLMAAALAKRAKVRSIALRMLWLLGKKAAVAIPVFIKALDDPHFHVQGAAAGCLAQFGVRASGAVTKLFKVVGNPNQFAKRHATDALSTILRSMGVLDPRLVTMLSHKDPQRRAGVAMTIQKLGKLAVFALPTLRKLLRDPVPLVRMQAAGAIGSFRDLGAPAIPDLRKATYDKSKFVRWYASAALSGIGRASFVAMPELLKGLQDPFHKVRLSCAAAMTNFGPKALPALPALRKALEHKDRYVRLYAAEAIGNIGPKARGAVLDLQRLLSDKWDGVRMAVRRALKKLKPPTKRTRPPNRPAARRK